MKRFITTFYAIFIVLLSVSQEKMDYFLPKDVAYNSDIPTPEHFFQQALGEWHLNHDQVMHYMKQIADLSERAIIKEYARSYENRPLVHLIFTSEKNHKNLDDLKALHYNFSEPGSEISENGVPVVVSLTYGVHGN